MRAPALPGRGSRRRLLLPPALKPPVPGWGGTGRRGGGRPCEGEGGSRRGGRREPGPPRLTAACGPFLPSWPRRQPGAPCSAEGAGSAGREKPLASVRAHHTHAPPAHTQRGEAHGRPSSPAPPEAACPPRLAEGRRAVEAPPPPGTPGRRAAPPWPRKAPTSPKS